MIRLTDEEILKVKVKLDWLDGDDTDAGIAKAQLKKVVEWLLDKYGVYLYDDKTGKRYDLPCEVVIDGDDEDWQALLEEVK